MVLSRFLSCSFLLKIFIQELWRHLLITAPFLAPWQALDGQKKQQ
jgi:hypothetical protein